VTIAIGSSAIAPISTASLPDHGQSRHRFTARLPARAAAFGSRTRL
jgi:hypothetical protein